MHKENNPLSKKDGRIDYAAQANYNFKDIGIILGCHRARRHHICHSKGAGLSCLVTRGRDGKQGHSSRQSTHGCFSETGKRFTSMCTSEQQVQGVCLCRKRLFPRKI